MKTTKSKNYLHSYYCSRHVKDCPVRVVLGKAEQFDRKERKAKKGMYALGSN